MNKTLILLTLPSLFAGCLEPNAMNKGGDIAGDTEGGTDGSGGATSMDPPSEETGADEPDPPETDGPAGTDGDPDMGTESGDAESSGESGSVEPEPSCDLTTHDCVSPVPEGWSGPVAQVEAGGETGCDGDFGEQVLDTFEEVFADPAACTCECGSPHGGACSETTVIDFYSEFTFFGELYNETTCESISYGDLALEFGSIEDFPSGWEDYDVRIIGTTPLVESAGSCDVATETSEVSDPTIVGQRLACAPAEPPSSCDDGSMCVPKVAAPFEPGVCIWAEGDLECPADTDFIHREVRGAGVVDTRACSDCSCNAASGEDCDDAVVRLWRTGGWVDRSVNGACNGANLGPGNTWTGVSFDPGDPSGGSCGAAGGDPEGSAEPEQQFTFCCT